MKIFLMALAGSLLCSASSWWNIQWQGRIPVTVSTGMTPAENAMVSVMVDCPQAALSSLRIVDASNNLVPSAVRRDDTDNIFIAWRIAEPQMLEELVYMIYLDKNDKAMVTEPAGFPKNLPGMNLLTNIDWQKKDAAGDIESWAVCSKGEGIHDQWTAELRNIVAVENKDNRCALRFSTRLITEIRGLEAGHTYRFSYEGMNSEPQLLTLSIWFRGQTIVQYLRSYQNYKMVGSVSSPGNWVKGCVSTFGYTDSMSKTVHNGEKNLLPGTECAFLELNPRGNKTAWVANLIFEDISENPLEAETGKVEWCKP